MCATEISVRVRRTALLGALFVCTASAVLAQQSGQPTLESALAAGRTVWITDSGDAKSGCASSAYRATS
jgi:hypothetical protein